MRKGYSVPRNFLWIESYKLTCLTLFTYLLDVLDLFPTTFIFCYITTFFLGTYCRRSHRRCSVKIMFLKISQNSQKNTCVGVLFDKLQVFRVETPTQVLSCVICEIFKNICFEEHLWTTTSENSRYDLP